MRGDIVRNLDEQVWRIDECPFPNGMLIDFLYFVLSFDEGSIPREELQNNLDARHRAFLEFAPDCRVSLHDALENPASCPQETGIITTGQGAARGLYWGNGKIWLISQRGSGDRVKASFHGVIEPDGT